MLLVLQGANFSTAADVRYVPVYPGAPSGVTAASPHGRYIVGKGGSGWFFDNLTNDPGQARKISFPTTYLSPKSHVYEQCQFIPNAVNDSGLVAGQLLVAGQSGYPKDSLATIWDPQFPSSFDILAQRPANYVGQWYGSANDIGYAPFNEVAGAANVHQGTVWNAFADFDTSPIIPNAINDNHAIVGWALNAAGVQEPAYKSHYAGPAPVQLLGSLPGFSTGGSAVDITDDGQIVGTCFNYDFVHNTQTTRAFYMHDADSPMLPLSIPFYPSSQAAAVNHAGTVVGSLGGTGSGTGFVWTAGSGVHYIAGLQGGSLDAIPVAITSEGVITAQIGSFTTRLIPYSMSTVDIFDPLLQLPPGTLGTATPSASPVNHEVSVVFHTPGSSFTHVEIPLFSVSSGDTDFQLMFNGLTFPLHVGQDFNFLDYVPNGVDQFTLAGLDLGTFGQIGNPLKLSIAFKYLSDATGVPTTADPLFAVAPEPSSCLLACVGLLLLAARRWDAQTKCR